MTKIFKQPMVVYSILVILLYTKFLPIHLVCIVFIFLILRSFLKKIGEKNWFLLQVEEDARTHQMHLESHFKFFIFLKKRALELSFFLTFLMLLQNSILFGYLSLNNALLITNITGVLKPVIFFIYAVLFIIHLIILAACNKGQGLDMFQTFYATLFVGSIATFTGYFGFNTVHNPTTHTGDINTTYSLFGHGPLRPTIDEHSAASVASSQAHYVNSLPFLHCAEDRTACHEFVNIMYERPPTYFDPVTGLERVDHRQMLKLLDIKRNYEAGFKLYFEHQTAVYQTTGLESDRPTLNKLSNSELSTLHTEKPLRRMHSGALQFGCSMDWEQELENLNSIEKNWDRNFMLSSCTRDEVLTRRNTCTDKYLSELLFARVSPSVTPVMQVKMDAKIQVLLTSQQR